MLTQVFATLGSAERQDFIAALERAVASPASADFAATTSPKCKSTSFPCGKSCQPAMSKSGKPTQCKKPLQGQAATHAAWLQMQAQKISGTPAPTGAPTPTPQPTQAKTKPPTAKLYTNDQELNSTRNDLIAKHGQKAVEAAEKNIQKVFNSPDNDVYIRVPDTNILNIIVGDRFKPALELHDMGLGRGQSYQSKRDRVERRVMGIPEPGKTGALKAEDRPIYGYLGGKDTTSGSHLDMENADYGNIAVKLKPDVKNRSTFTGSDSFKSGIASELVNLGDPPPPSAASFVSKTFHGFDRDKIPPAYALANPSYDMRTDKGRLAAAAKAKTPEDLARAVAPHGNAYVETQIYGQVKGTDIAEIHFNPKKTDGSDAPDAKIATWAKANGVKIYVKGKEQNLDDLISPNKTKQLADAVAKGDYQSAIALAQDVKARSNNFKGPAGQPPDKILGTLYKDAGYDGKPKVGTSDDVTNAWKSGGNLMIRGCDPINGDRTKALTDFQSGEYFVGNGMYGNGTYVAHAGKFSGSKFTGHNPNSADADAEGAFDCLSKNSYVKSFGVTMRMALPKDANIISDIDLNKQITRHRRKLDKLLQDEKDKLIAASPVAAQHQKDVVTYKTEVQKTEKEHTKNYAKRPELITTSAQTVTLPGKRKPTTLNTYQVNLKHKKGGQDLQIEGSVEEVAGPFGSIVYKIKDKNGQEIIPNYYKNLGHSEYTAITKKQALDDLMSHHIEKQALKNTGFSSPPDSKNVSNAVDSKTFQKIKDLEDAHNTLKQVFYGDEGGGVSGRFATIHGYDAIALKNGWGQDSNGDPRFMNLLNRSKVIIQKDELDFNTGRRKIKG